MTTSPARRVAFSILRRVEEEGAYASTLLSSLDENMRDDDRGLCHELVFGVLRRQLWLDSALEHFANRRIDDLDLPVRLALRLGLYQLQFLSRIPPSAAVNESVNLVYAARLKSAAGLVNAVLRRAAREPNYDPAASVADSLQRLAISTSHPRWMIERWSAAFGVVEAAALAHSNNEPASVAFRFTARTIDSPSERQRIVDDLRSAAGVSPSMVAPGAWRVDGPGKLVRKLSQGGLIYLQDEASQLVAHLLAPQSSDRVLDVCAAPGSKTTHLASLVPQAVIIAGDFRENRLRTLQELARQQGVANVHLAVHDATNVLPFAEGSFESVLVDAPCSGTGTLRGNPEIRWRLQASDVAELSIKQTQILANAATMVCHHGRLVYSTCSLEPEENERVVETFLRNHADFGSAKLDAPSELITNSGAVRTWPHRQGVDGFFVAAFERLN